MYRCMPDHARAHDLAADLLLSSLSNLVHFMAIGEDVGQAFDMTFTAFDGEMKDGLIVWHFPVKWVCGNASQLDSVFIGEGRIFLAGSIDSSAGVLVVAVDDDEVLLGSIGVCVFSVLS